MLPKKCEKASIRGLYAMPYHDLHALEWGSTAATAKSLGPEIHLLLQVLKSGLHVALKAEDYVSGVRQSIMAGGDTTSRCSSLSCSSPDPVRCCVRPCDAQDQHAIAKSYHLYHACRQESSGAKNVFSGVHTCGC